MFDILIMEDFLSMFYRFYVNFIIGISHRFPTLSLSHVFYQIEENCV